ncbi:MAG: hypothetical protein ACU85E_08095 [Gammaproteobacteria bacterium]
MHIILVRIPAETTKNDIIHFFEPVLKKGFFVRKGIIEHIEIKIIHDSSLNAMEFHGLVKIKPDVVALKAIKKLNRKVINGKHIAVREYHFRNWQNDPRLKPLPTNLKFRDRRKEDRRRNHLHEVTHETAHFSSNKIFHRTF